MPRISIIMPLYNSEKYLHEAIDSILNQTYNDWELIVINEFGSEDGSREIVEEYAKYDDRIILLQNENRLRISASMNRGIEEAKGEFIARMDADDISLPDRFEKQIEYLEKHDDIVMCGCKVEIFGDNAFEWKLETDFNQLSSNILFYSPCVHPTIMVRKQFLDDNNIRYNNNYTASEDYDFFSQICKYGKIANVDKVLFRYRIMNNNATFRNNDVGLVIYNEIMQRQFMDLGLDFNETELKLLSPHYSVKGLKGREVLEAITKLEILLKRIFVANDKCRKYDSVYLWRTLYKRYNETVESIAWFCNDYDDKKLKTIAKNSIFSNKDFYVTNEKTIKEPKVTVLMPTYNSEDYILGAIWSVLNQTFQDFEILIVNEYGSDDDTIYIANIFKDKRIRIIQNKEKKGLAESLNIGIREAAGEYIARLDADDICHRERLMRQVDFLDENQEYGICGTWQHHFGIDTDWNHKGGIKNEDIMAELIFNCDLCHSTLMLRKSMFIENNLFYDSTYAAEDYELWTRCIKHFKIANIPMILGEYRVGEANITSAKMDILSKESGELVAKNIKHYFDYDIPEDMIPLQSGWRNEFLCLPTNKQKKALATEKELLEKICEINKGKQIFNEKSLLKTINKKWKKIIGKDINDDNTYDLETLFNKFNYEDKEKGIPNKEKKHFVKRAIKKILSKPYYAFKWRTFDVIQQSLWDVDGHINDLKDYVNEVDKRILNVAENKASIDKKFEELLCEIREINSETDKAIREINSETDKAIREINAKTDYRIWIAELNLEKEINAQIWNLNRKINRLQEQSDIKNPMYNDFFYLENQYGSYTSAIFVFRLLMPILKSKSVIDFGCGTGTWTYAAKQYGATDVTGVDGDYVNRDMLMINENEFMPFDLTKPFSINKKFDLAISMEVAEHLEEEFADIFISTICNHSDIVLFSAAHPGQGGDGHVNEQPIEYWQNKFAIRGYECIDIRPAISNNYKIESWYRENINIFIKKNSERIQLLSKLKNELCLD